MFKLTIVLAINLITLMASSSLASSSSFTTTSPIKLPETESANNNINRTDAKSANLSDEFVINNASSSSNHFYPMPPPSKIQLNFN